MRILRTNHYLIDMLLRYNKFTTLIIIRHQGRRIGVSFTTLPVEDESVVTARVQSLGQDVVSRVLIHGDLPRCPDQRVERTSSLSRVDDVELSDVLTCVTERLLQAPHPESLPVTQESRGVHEGDQRHLVARLPVQPGWRSLAGHHVRRHGAKQRQHQRHAYRQIPGGGHNGMLTANKRTVNCE